MIVDIITFVLLSVLLFWVVYNGAIIYVGVRNIKKPMPKPKLEVTELPKYSIIVPTKNEVSVIKRCLEGFLAVDYPRSKLEVVVVDGASTDGTQEVCLEYEKHYPDFFKVISEGSAHGKPAALNLALKHTTGDVIAVFDADSLPVSNIFNLTNEYFADKEIMAVQGRTTSINERSSVLTRVIATEEKAWFQMLLSGRERLKLFVPLNGTCQFVRRSVFERIGVWDENSLTEDVEYALRLVEKGGWVKYAPDVCSGQETPSTMRSLINQRTRWYRGYMETAVKYGRLLGNINKRTLDAEISMGGPFMMVISLLSYINWFLVAVFFSQRSPLLNFTGLVIVLTAVSLVSIGLALVASEKPIKKRNVLLVPSIYFYWMFQMFIAFWAFLKFAFRRKRVWTKTAKDGSYVPGDACKQNLI